jgi:hypothetical protein
MPYNEEVMNTDAKYQKESTVQNELAMEKAKLKFWQDKLKENPSDTEAETRIIYHKAEVERLESVIKLA